MGIKDELRESIIENERLGQTLKVISITGHSEEAPVHNQSSPVGVATRHSRDLISTFERPKGNSDFRESIVPDRTEKDHTVDRVSSGSSPLNLLVQVDLVYRDRRPLKLR